MKPAPRATSPRRLSPSARPLRRRRPYQPDLLLLLRLSLDRSLAQLLLLLPPSLVLLLCSNLATLQLTESTFGSVDFQGLGGSPELRKNHPQRGRGLAGEVPHYLS